MNTNCTKFEHLTTRSIHKLKDISLNVYNVKEAIKLMRAELITIDKSTKDRLHLTSDKIHILLTSKLYATSFLVCLRYYNKAFKYINASTVQLLKYCNRSQYYALINYPFISKRVSKTTGKQYHIFVN